jgi:tetratricopeptide (TPR) repeat protein
MSMPEIDEAFAGAEREGKAGNWEAAHAGYLGVLALDPTHAGAMLPLSYIESRRGHYRAARGWALRAAAGDAIVRPDALRTLMKALRTFNEVAALRELVGRLLEDPRTPHTALVEAAWQLASANDADLALRCARVALKKAPDDLAGRLVRGQLRAHHGRLDEAGKDFDWVLQRNPRIAIGWWLLSRLRKQSPGSNHVARLRAVLGTPGLAPADAATIARALHKELDDMGDHEGAWQALETLCRARRGTLRYDARQSRDLVDALVAWAPADPGAAIPRDSDRIPIFIVGMHRSGTTLLEQLLDASPQVRGVGELDDFAAAMRHATDHACKDAVDGTIVARAGDVDFGEVGRRYMEGIGWRLGKERFFTDKQPANFLNIGFMLRALPQARVLHLVRDPVETCFSNLRELFFGINPYSYDQLELADYFLQYRRLMAHWHAVYPGRVLDVSYAALTHDTEATMRGVAAFCGIDYDPGMSDPRSSKRAVTTASSVQVRDGVVRLETPKWKPYARHLQPLVRALREGGVEFADASIGRA